MSPSWDWFREVALPHARALGQEITVECARRGFYPKGGGEVRLVVRPRFGGGFDAIKAAVRASVPPYALEHGGTVLVYDVYSIASDALSGQTVAERQVEGTRATLRDGEMRVHREYVRTFSIGTSVTAVARLSSGSVVGGDALGERGKRAEDVGREAAEALAAELQGGAPVDEHLADHLVPWLALRGGSFRANVLSEHTRTNAWLVEQFVGPAFTIDERGKTVCSR
jgi:RNA 3'-terminal phosphate cyclase